MNKNLKQTQGNVALSLVPRSPSYNKGYTQFKEYFSKMNNEDRLSKNKLFINY